MNAITEQRYSIKQLATKSNRSVTSIRRDIEAGRLQSVQYTKNGKRYITETEANAYIHGSDNQPHGA